MDFVKGDFEVFLNLSKCTCVVSSYSHSIILQTKFPPLLRKVSPNLSASDTTWLISYPSFSWFPVNFGETSTRMLSSLLLTKFIPILV